MTENHEELPIRVGICMGSDSDLPVMREAAEVLAEFGVGHELRVLSAHRTPEAMFDYARAARDRGLVALIAGAGGAAHLPGMTAAMTHLPVFGVPIPSKHLQGLDSLLSIVQMPASVPVATMAIGGGKNAGLFLLRMLAVGEPALRAKLDASIAATEARIRGVDARVERTGA
ncbi:MAG: 5-(carboxyamino)imidazole ribonucleotide mutase [Myxococcales bacterium]|nr:5-(carboxyamino)imidazole ribonucleotide mutase [Myxococcales bacterium]